MDKCPLLRTLHGKPAKNTTLVYRDTLESLWLIDKVEPWLPGWTSFKYLGKTPKHFLADPALSARLLDITPDRLLQGAGVEPLGSPEKTITGAELRHLHWLENQFTEYYVIKMVVNSGPNAYIRKNIENPC